LTHSTLLRRISCILLAILLTSCPVSAFVIGTAEDLEALTASPENSDPVTGKNLNPIATNLEFSTYKNVAIQEKLSAVDPDGDRLHVRVIKNPARGSVSLAEEGSLCFTYTPYENKIGKDTFTYVAEDAYGNISTPATVKIKIQKPKTKVTYADMNGNPAHKAAVRLAELDVLVGQRMGDTYCFHPEENVTREEFLSMAMNALGSEVLPDAVTTGFSDNDAIAVWAKPYVASALRFGMVTGSSDEQGQAVFQPNRPITCGEATVLLNRLLQLSDVSIDKTVQEDGTPAWASQSVLNLETVGILSGDVELSAPLTKGNSAMLLSAALDVLDFRESSSKHHFF
jgi:hypothetical protein